MKKALITGVTGQDGSYLAELLLEKGYQVHGLVRRHSTPEVMPNIQHLRDRIVLHQGDLSDATNLRRLLSKIKPDEIYNLAAMSHVHVSFEIPVFTAEANAVGVLNLLEAMREYLAENNHVRFYQASTSEMFGKVQAVPQNETTPFYPRSPYGVAKLYAHWITVNYRESYDMHASCGILFNHESPRRGEEFVTRKITKGFARIQAKLQNSVILGNLDAMRDWGHARDYVEGMWRIVQHDTPGDYVLATNKQHSVRDFCTATARWFGKTIEWRGEGVQEKGLDADTGQVYFEVHPSLYRPAEVNTLLGDYNKAYLTLDWYPKTTFDDLVADMCENDAKIVGLSR